jgi:hypothetical protein
MKKKQGAHKNINIIKETHRESLESVITDIISRFFKTRKASDRGAHFH